MIAAFSVDGAKMFAESYLEKRYQDGFRVGFRDGLKDGFREGHKRLLKDLVRLQLITEEQLEEFEKLRKEHR